MQDPLTKKRVVIIGLARQGTALAKWLVSINASVLVTDLRSADVLAEPLRELDGLPIDYVLGEHPNSILAGADVVAVSGGVPLEAPIVREAISRGITLTNDAQLFLERCPCHVIGITGSAGKTTTTALVGAMFEAAGMLPWVGGNIGNPLIADLPFIRPDDVAVMELSSFQLELMTTSPHVAAVLNVTPNHLDRHKTMDNYVEAKARILSSQLVGDVAVFNRDDPHSNWLSERALADVSMFSARVPVDVGAWLVGDRLVTRPKFSLPMETVTTVHDINLRGHHNVMNTLAACAIAGAGGVPVDAMREAIHAFEPVEHRLEIVRVTGDVTYINDSIATAPERVIAALEAYPDDTIVLLLGGRDKDLPWDDLLEMALDRTRAIIAFGEAGHMIASRAAQLRSERGAPTPIEQADGLDDAVRMAHRLAQPGDMVMLSPGGTSFDAYEDFAARGEHFRQLVRGLR